jgi:AmmeMemoRadiSam system protein B
MPTAGKVPLSFAAKHIRGSVIAGSWYPGDPKQLRAMIQGFLDKVAPQALAGELVGLVSPHAGYVYSGQVAACAYALLSGQSFSRVLIVSPVHRMYPGRFAITDKSGYETPLGSVPLDVELLQAMERRVELNRVTQDMEHSLEIQLPFLQHMLGDFLLTPIMMGEQDWESSAELGKAIADAVGNERVLLVASTDLSHFHRYSEAMRLDRLVLDRIAALDPEGLAAILANRKAEACGGGPVSAVMVAARALGVDHATVLKYLNSGDVTGDHREVVGYAAAALLRARLS